MINTHGGPLAAKFKTVLNYGGSIVLYAPNSTEFVAPSSGTNNQQVNGFVALSLVSATGVFKGATAWRNTNGIVGTQAFRFDIPVSSPPGTSRLVNYRFNNFSLDGNCAVCAQTFFLNSASATSYPMTGIVDDAGTSTPRIRGGSIYGQQAITASLGIWEATVSFEARASNPYTITVQARRT